jgi:hypothetical protein
MIADTPSYCFGLRVGAHMADVVSAEMGAADLLREAHALKLFAARLRDVASDLESRAGVTVDLEALLADILAKVAR